MTVGSNQNGPNPSDSRRHAIHPRDERETLSALFDGELPDDAARFALKRLDHDAGWRETCGRWQLIGDALRGEATMMAPANFATGVMRVLATENEAIRAVALPRTSIEASSQSAVAARRRWLGGALAASVAMAAVLVVRPWSQSTDSAPREPLATRTVAPAPSLSAPAIAAPSTTSSPSLAAGESGSAATEARFAANDAVPASRRPALDRRPVRASRAASAPASRTDEPATAFATATPTPNATRQPFHPPSDEIATRPWPRAALPDAAAAGSLTVGFGDGTPASVPSLYPFEPRLPMEAPPPEAQR